ncbi:MAG: DAK2 domain-containing protein [Acidimicrobiia bacterium]
MSPNRLSLRPQDLKQILNRYLKRLRQHREALNRLNVYPVPDGDTGTNMTLTVESVVAEVEPAESMEEVASALAHGALMGAQGNSGIILSQILRGLADAFRDAADLGTSHLVDALDRASEASYKAVGKPVEGTILTVLREASEAAHEAETSEGEDLADLLRRVYGRAETSLRNTPELLPVLKEAGVVDAGAAGFLLLLVAFLEEVTGSDVPLPEAIFSAAAARRVHPADGVADDRSIADLRYEVMYLLRSEDQAAGDLLRETWASMGESVVVVGGEGVWNCHIHTDDIGPALEAGIEFGRPERIKITDLLDQVSEESFHDAIGFRPRPEFEPADPGIVAVGVGEGIVGLFRDAGVQGMVLGGQTMNPSVRDVLGVVDSVAASNVIVLPNNKNIVPVADQLDALSTKRVHVVPTRSVPEGLAAMIAYMPGGDPDATVAGMTAAAGDVTSGEVTRAVRDATTPAGEISESDWLGIVSGDVAVIADECSKAVVGVLGRIVDDDSEIITIITGSDAEPEMTERIIAGLEEHNPDVTIEVVAGGQPLYPYLFGVE